MKFSIIVPAYNTGRYIKSCLESIAGQEPGGYDMEVLLVDDRSTDNTLQIVKEFIKKHKGLVRVFENKKNIGLGLTRNRAIEDAAGDWLIFLDSDDKLSQDALKKLSEYIGGKDDRLDLVGYNWAYDPDSGVKSGRYGGRWDLNSLLKSKDELIKDYVSLGMDNSVIYTAIKKNLVDAHKLRFKEGLHEDVEFMLKAYFYANENGLLDLPLYIKNNRESSIVNSISEDHIKDFSRALKGMYDFLNSHNIYKKNSESYYYGVLRVVATQVRSIRKGCESGDRADKLYAMLYDEYAGLLKDCGIIRPSKKHFFEAKYIMIADHFFDLMSLSPKSGHKDMADFLDGIDKKSWSCYSLHHAIFLAPDEIRTCCKRFFVNNEMRGDAVLLGGSKDRYDEFTPENILKEKRGLHVRINRGVAKECMGCPYLEFKDWEAIEDLKIEYIALEYSSVCNMRCVYCNDKYYGGERAKYDVEVLVKQLFETESLQPCNTIVWGGGELSLDSSFEKLLTFMASNFPDVKQRVFTNAARFSGVIDKYLGKGNILSITSIDAGNEDNFYKIRRHKGFKEVLENLKRYSSSGPGNMIIKYIITEHNGSLEELRSFVHQVREHSLEKCNFQISFDFKKEFVDLDSLVSAIALFTYLSDINVRFVFFDDLLWQRISKKLGEHYNEILKKLEEMDLVRAFADRRKYNGVVIWGAGTQAKFLMEKSAFFKEVKIEYLVDNSAEKVSKDFFGHRVLSPKALLDSDHPVLIAAVQNAPKILENFYKLGFKESRLIRGLVI